MLEPELIDEPGTRRCVSGGTSQCVITERQKHRKGFSSSYLTGMKLQIWNFLVVFTLHVDFLLTGADQTGNETSHGASKS